MLGLQPLLGCASALAALLIAMMDAAAQQFPTRPVRVVVGFAPGGGPDIVARIVAEPLTARLGQTVVIDNRGGANGIVGAEIVSRSNPDGYTVLVTSASFAINPSIYRKLPFDPLKDFTPLMLVASGGGQILAVHPSVPVQSVADLIAHAKKPGVRLAYGSAGQGNATHLSAVLFSMRAGVDMVHVPYKSAGLGAQALMANEVQVMFMSIAAGMPFVKAGRIRPLAYAGAKRTDLLPDVPTLTEAGVANANLSASWYGAFLPPRVSPALVSRLNDELRAALRDPQARTRLAAAGLEADASTPAEFASFLQGAIRRYGEIVRAAKIEPQ